MKKEIELTQQDLNYINDYLEIQLEKFRKAKIDNNCTQAIRNLYTQLPLGELITK